MTAALRNWGGIGPGSTDADLALAAADGDRRAFAEIYDRYADRLHDFAIGMLRDRDSAADCVQDAFCIASTTLSGLREPDKLRPWLYAIVRNEAHKRLRQLRRERPSDEMPDVVSHDAGPDTLAHRMELANLISEAAGGLSDRDQAVLELAYRQGLDGPELAMALGVTQTNANTMVGRLRETIERSLGALLVARRVQSDPGSCPELAAVLHGWDGKFNILMRKRIARHIESCGACEDLRSRSVSPAALLGAPVFIPAPAWLKNSVQRDFELTSASHGMGTSSQGAVDRRSVKLPRRQHSCTARDPAAGRSPSRVVCGLRRARGAGGRADRRRLEASRRAVHGAADLHPAGDPGCNAGLGVPTEHGPVAERCRAERTVTVADADRSGADPRCRYAQRPAAEGHPGAAARCSPRAPRPRCPRRRRRFRRRNRWHRFRLRRRPPRHRLHCRHRRLPRFLNYRSALFRRSFPGCLPSPSTPLGFRRNCPPKFRPNYRRRTLLRCRRNRPHKYLRRSPTPWTPRQSRCPTP